VDWVRHLKPEAVICENVKEFISHGPIIQKRDKRGELVWALNAKPVKALPPEHQRGVGESEEAWSERMKQTYVPYEVPDKTRKGEYFRAWVAQMDELGYDHEHRVLCSADYGDPTIRARLFVYFVRRGCGKRIVWPEPYAAKPDKNGKVNAPMAWRTARQCICWNLKGTSVFTRKKKLAANTMRRLAIGLVKFGMKEFLVSSAHGSRRPSDCDVRVHDPDTPLPTLTQKGERGLVEVRVVPYVLPKDGGYQQDHVRSVDYPIGGITTKSHEVLIEPAIVQMKGQSTAQSIDEPLTAVTGCLGHYLMEPMIDHLRGTGVVSGVDAPLRTLTTGGNRGGGHQALAEAFVDAFMFSIDQTGGAKSNHGCYPVDEPVRTLVTKANATCVEVEVEQVSAMFLQSCEAKGVDTSRATLFLEYLVDALKRYGKVCVKPWIYVYYSNGSEGKGIDEPLPAVRTKAGHALVYPVIELHGMLLKIDLLYRMLTPLELQRAMGFPDDMQWGDANKTEQVRAIGNAVSRGVARALGLAWYSQESDVWKYVKNIYGRH